ncbi:MAG: hypothetical protein IJT92_03505 [Spirochaetia bacterium]|nr:hypothetical protein [Spirochaetia bacterium]MBR0318925.1 hypothetical protein [Spirochaetia bacterium]
MAALYSTIYYDKWQAVTDMKAISKRERQKLACALLDYACFGTEPEELTNAALSMFNVIKTSLGARRHRGGQIGNHNARKTNDETNTENEYQKRIVKTNTENELVTSDTEHAQSLTKTETESEYVDSNKTPKRFYSRSTQEKEKAEAKEKKAGVGLDVCPKCLKPLTRHYDRSLCIPCGLIFSKNPQGEIVTEQIVDPAAVTPIIKRFSQ